MITFPRLSHHYFTTNSYSIDIILQNVRYDGDGERNGKRKENEISRNKPIGNHLAHIGSF